MVYYFRMTHLGKKIKGKFDKSEEKATHSTTHSLTIAENVKFVDELVKIMARFGDRRQVSLKQDIIVLL